MKAHFPIPFDRNANGLIDSGRELFGVDTLLSGTPGIDAVYAATGFAALAALDTNADNLFNASDAAFAEVRLWRDLNQDGVSQSGELFTLAQQNIASISLTASSANINLGNGNTVSGTAVVTRTNGTTTLAETVGVAADTTAANLNLTNNPFYREFTTLVALTAAATTLPEMGGSGWVRDLREAMSLGTAQGEALAAQVAAFSATTTRDAQMALLDDVLRLWAETNQSQSMGPVDDAHRRFVLTGDAVASARLQWAIPILEVFNGMGVNDAGMQAPSTSTGGDGLPVLTYGLFANQAPTMLGAYEALKNSVYAALVTQTRLEPYLDAIELVIDESGVRFDTAAAVALVNTKAGADAYNAVADLIDLKKYADATLIAVGWQAYGTLSGVLQTATITAPIQALLTAEQIAWLPASGTNYALTGSAGATVLGNASNNVLTGAAGNDTLYGNAGNDTLDGGAGTNVMDGGDGDDVITSSAVSANTLLGGAGNDSLSVFNTSDNNVFDGGTGNDTMTGGYLRDTYRFGLGGGQDSISDLNGSSGYYDRLVFGAGIAPADISVVRSGNSLLFRHTNGLDQVTVNNWFANSNYWIETVEFHDGVIWDATKVNASALTTVAGTPAADALTGTANADQIAGLDGNDTLDGLAGHDWLDGGLGADTMRGGVGDDVYVVDNLADLVTELANEGRDAVRSSVTWTLGTNIEDLVLTGTAAINGTGNVLDNVIYGNAAANVLAGGAGNDRYYVGAGDSVTEAANAGTDTVVSTATWTLGSNIENLILVGTAAINGTGNTLANVLTGNAAANTLNGGTGADTMLGGAGNDIYTVDNAGDVVTELASEGIDRVNSSIGYTLGANVENLTLTGSALINGTGNGLDNILTGNAANNTLTGGAGNDTLNGGTGDDTMLGGTGNDIYVVNVATDVVTELANEGTDTVQSAAAWTLGDNLENLTLTGSTAISGTGNALNNVLTGNSGANTLTGGAGNDTLDGGAGSDTMLGGSGDDIYVVNAAGDVTTENANEGIDTVRSSVTRTLGNELENLALTGARVINGTGNALNNLLTGNAANNTLAGLAGDDTYDGGAGNDKLSDNSTSSNDIYRWGIGQGNDTITDAGGTADRIEIAAGVSASQVTLTRSGNNLLVGIIGAADVLTVANWYVGAANKIEEIRLADGSMIAAGTVAPLAVMSTPTPAARMVRLADPAPSAALADDARMLNSAQSLVQAMAQFGAAGAAMDAPWSWPARHEAGPLLAMPY